MPEYPHVPISECCDILDHRRIPVNEDERSQRIGIIPYYGANGLQGHIDNWIFDEPLILLAEDGGNFDDFINRAIAYRISGKTWVNNHAHVLRAKHGYVQEFVFYCLEHKDIRPSIKGGTRGKLNQADLKNIRIPRPEEPQQRRIAEILTTVDNQIEKTEALIAKYQAIKQGLMHDLFTRGVDEHGRLRPTRDEAPQLYKDSELGWIPKDWDVRVVNNLVSPSRPVVYGILMPGYGWPGGVPVIKVKDIQEGQVITTDLLLTSPEIDASYRRSKTQVGDLLFTIRGSVGRMAFVPATLPDANITQDTARIGVVGADPRFVRGALETPAAKRFIKVHTLGVAVQGINLGDVRRIPILFPSLKEQGRIGDRIEAADKRIDAEVDWLNKLRVLKLGLMKDLLTGKVLVKPEHSDQDNGVTSNGAAKAGVKSRAEGVHA
ncbi:MAG: restriction endonuclease subunit S [Phycisphaeraceae bacterium]|nr:restriction endonuclease subunit S [Phycisphaeraceae bacterium]